MNFPLLPDIETTTATPQGLMTRSRRQGFTIIELLIVIVVVAILAAITTVAYANIQERTRKSIIQSDLSNFAKLAEMYRINNGRYPAANIASLDELNFRASKAGYPSGTGNLDYCVDNGRSQYILYVHVSSDRLNGMYVSSNNSAPKAIVHEPPYDFTTGAASPCYNAWFGNSAATDAGLTGITGGITGFRSTDSRWSSWTE